MIELRVPTIATVAQVTCADGRVFSGQVYIPAAAFRHTGPMRTEEWINAPAAFFPFLPDGEEGPVLINKDEVVAIDIADPPRDEEDPPVPDGEVRNLTVECGGLRFQGELHIDMPEGQRRVLDAMNQPERFMSLLAGGRHYLVNKRRVTRVLETKGA